MTTTTNISAPIMTALAVDRAMKRYSDAIAVGRRLAWARTAAGITQAELAWYIGISQPTLSRVEHGERALRPIERALASRALGCSIALLAAPTLSLAPVSNGNGKQVAA